MRSIRDRELPEPFQAWIDRRQPLPAEVILFPRAVPLWSDLAILVMLGGMFGGMGVLIVTMMPPWRFDPAETGWTPHLFIGAICLGLWSVPLLLLRRTWITAWAARDRRRGRLRQGVFLGPAGMLVRMEPNCCYPIAWERFVVARFSPRMKTGEPEHPSTIIETRDGQVAFFSDRLSVEPDEICRSVPKFLPKWTRPKRAERADRTKRIDHQIRRQMRIGIALFVGGMSAVFISTAAVIMAGEKSPYADIIALVIFVSLIFVGASVVNMFYRFGKLKLFYRCPECRQRLARVDSVRPAVNYYCPSCNIEWLTGWKEVGRYQRRRP